jgi:hypothetical protein
MARMIRTMLEPSEESKAENEERVRILADLDNPSDDVATKKQKYIEAFNDNDSLRTEIERSIRLFTDSFRYNAECTITQASMTCTYGCRIT